MKRTQQTKQGREQDVNSLVVKDIYKTKVYGWWYTQDKWKWLQKERKDKKNHLQFLYWSVSQCLCYDCSERVISSPDQWHQQMTASGFLSPVCDCITAGALASFQTLTICFFPPNTSEYVSTTTDALLSPLSLPPSIFLHHPSIFLSISTTPTQSPFLTVRGMIDSCELSDNCIIISQPSTFDCWAYNKYCRCIFISQQICFNHWFKSQSVI